MANEYQLEIIKKGAKFWNQWRADNKDEVIDLSKARLVGANLSGADFSNANFTQAQLLKADLSYAKLTGAQLVAADFWKADLSRCDASGADLSASKFLDTNLSWSNFTGANFWRADLSDADLTGADLSEARLSRTLLVGTYISQAIFYNCHIYGLSVWDIKGVPALQQNLIITPWDQAAITVDDLEVAQFIYLLLKNEKLKSIIDTLTSKVVLILGRFTEERKAVLDAIREELRNHNLTPVVFDFDKPVNKDITGTVETLARMARFIIADLTDPSSIPHELATVIPFLRTTPVLPIRLQGTGGYSMFEDFQRDLSHRVLATYEYRDSPSLITALPQIIAPANEKVEALRSHISLKANQ